MVDLSGCNYKLTLDANNPFDLSISYKRTPSTDNMPVYHFHRNFEVYYVLSGAKNYFIENTIYRVEKGDIVLIDQNVIHRTSGIPDQQCERLLVAFTDRFLAKWSPNVKEVNLLAPFERSTHALRLTLEQQQFVETLFGRIAAESEAEEPENGLSIQLLVLQLLLFLKRSARGNLLLVPRHPNPKFQKVSDVIVYINERYDRALNLKTICKEFYVSPSHFTKLFKAATGFTFTEYLNNVRVKQAQALLHLSDLRVSEIAERVGYSSLTHFNRVFKRLSGTSPLAFRKRARAELPI